MKLTSKFKTGGHYTDLTITVKMNTKELTREESLDKQRKLNNEIFNALREFGYNCQDISIQ